MKLYAANKYAEGSHGGVLYNAPVPYKGGTKDGWIGRGVYAELQPGDIVLTLEEVKRVLKALGQAKAFKLQKLVHSRAKASLKEVKRARE